MIDRLAAAAEEGKAKGVKGLPMKLGMEMAAEMIAKIKDEHLCDGVHIMAIGAEKNVPAILDSQIILCPAKLLLLFLFVILKYTRHLHLRTVLP